MTATPSKAEDENSDEDKDIEMSDDEGEDKIKLESTTPLTPLDQSSVHERLKRKRSGADEIDGMKDDYTVSTPNKRVKSETPPPAPPPPPSPPFMANGTAEASHPFGDEGTSPDMETDIIPFDEAMSALNEPPPPPPPPDPGHLHQLNDFEDVIDDEAGLSHSPGRAGAGDEDSEQGQLSAPDHGRTHSVKA